MRICLLLLFPTLLYSQNLAIEATTGVQTGWWVYDKGSTDLAFDNNLGWDRSHHAPFWPVGIGAFYRIGRFKLGAAIHYSRLFDKTMIGSRDSDVVRDRYPISDGAVKFVKYGLQTEFELIAKMRYTMAPLLRFGWFQIDTLHPEKDNFGRKTFWDFGLTNEIKFGKLGFIMRLIYSVLEIQPEQARNRNEHHDFYNFGLNLGVRYWLK